MFCRNCGANIGEGQKFCDKCGAAVIVQAAPSAPQIPPQKKSAKTGLIISIVAAVILLAAAAFSIWYFLMPKKAVKEESAASKSIAESEKPDTDDKTTTKKEAQKKSPDNLLKEIIAESIQQKGSLLDEAKKLYFEEYSGNFSASGVLGAVIEDLDGNKTEEAVIIYLEETEDTAASYRVLADVYGLENDKAVKKKSRLLLTDQVGIDETDFNVYLKKTENGCILIGDYYDYYCHWADGSSWGIHAYDCRNLAFSNVSDYFTVGSSFEESDAQEHVQAARRAGMLGVTKGLTPGPLFLQDTDIRLICNISTVIYENTAFSTGNNYGIISFSHYTNDDYELDSEKTTAFIAQEEKLYQNTAPADNEYIFPNSSVALLTANDLQPIKDNADMLRKARNEIYARHGRKFNDTTLQAYFETKSWYVPQIEADDFSENMLSELEKENCRFIKTYEDALQ